MEQDRTNTTPPKPERPAASLPHRSKWHRLFVWTAVLLIFGVIFWLVLRHHDEAQTATSSRRAFAGPVTITTATAKKSDIGVYLDAIGTVTPVYTDSITSQVTGLVTQVHYQVREARSQYFPAISVAPSATRGGASANLNNASNNNTNTAGSGSRSQVSASLYTLPLEASWEPDLWGKVRNTVRENQYAAQVSAADLETERLTEEASLAEYFFEIRGQDQLQEIYNQTVEADQKALDLTRAL